MSFSTGEEILTISRAEEILASTCGRQIAELGVEVVSDNEANGKVTIGKAVFDLGEGTLCSGPYNNELIQTLFDENNWLGCCLQNKQGGCGAWIITEYEIQKHDS